MDKFIRFLGKLQCTQCEYATSKKEKLADHLAWHEKNPGASVETNDKGALQNHTQGSSSSEDDDENDEENGDENSGVGSGSNRIVVDEDADDDEVARVTSAANMENGDDGEEDEHETSGRTTQNGSQAYSSAGTNGNGGLGFLNMWMSAAPSLLDCYYAELLGAAANQQTPNRTAGGTLGASSSLSARDSPRDKDDTTGSGTNTPSLLGPFSGGQKSSNGGGIRNLDSPTSGIGQSSASKEKRRTDTCEYCGKVCNSAGL